MMIESTLEYVSALEYVMALRDSGLVPPGMDAPLATIEWLLRNLPPDGPVMRHEAVATCILIMKDCMNLPMEAVERAEMAALLDEIMTLRSSMPIKAINRVR